jgi:hypothetical protein
MIKKLGNQPYAPKSGVSSQMGAKRKKKKIRHVIKFDIVVTLIGYIIFLYIIALIFK